MMESSAVLSEWPARTRRWTSEAGFASAVLLVIARSQSWDGLGGQELGLLLRPKFPGGF